MLGKLFHLVDLPALNIGHYTLREVELLKAPVFLGVRCPKGRFHGIHIVIMTQLLFLSNLPTSITGSQPLVLNL